MLFFLLLVNIIKIHPVPVVRVGVKGEINAWNTMFISCDQDMHFAWFSRRDGVFVHELTVSCPEPRSGEDRIW